MLAILILAVVLFVAAIILTDDKSSIDMLSMAVLAAVPSIVALLINALIAAFELNPAFYWLTLIVCTFTVFFMSDVTLVWGRKKSSVLAGVYVVFSVSVPFVLQAIENNLML